MNLLFTRSFLTPIIAAFAVSGVMAQTNVAIGKTATSSESQDGNPGRAQFAIDGNLSSSWESKHGVDKAWLTIDLGKVYTGIENVVMVWENAYGKHYTIDVAGDDGVFSIVKEVNEELTTFPNYQNVKFSAPISARYVRFSGIERGLPYGYNLWEMQIYSTMFDPDINLALGKSSSTGYSSNTAADANDGNLYTRLVSGGLDDVAQNVYNNQWWEVDLEADYNLSNIHIYFEGAYPKQFELLGRSNTADEWQTLKRVTDAPTKISQTEYESYDVTGTHARYVRIHALENQLPQYGMSLWEFEVYGLGLYDDGVEDTEAPVMASAQLVDASVYDATLLVSATDNITPTVTLFTVEDEENGILLNLTTNDKGEIVIPNLKPSTTYSFIVKAKDSKGNVSTEGISVELTTQARPNDAEGDIGHFAVGALKRIHYVATASEDGNLTITISPIDATDAIDFAHIMVVNKGELPMEIAADGSSASYTFANMNSNEEVYFAFLYSLTSLPGNEQTAETLTTNDANILYFRMSQISLPTHLQVIEATDDVQVYDLNGRKVATFRNGEPISVGTNGIYIIKKGSVVKKVRL